jgi:excisionase family DNA binding protein
MPRVFDVIDLADEMRNDIVRKFPETGAGDFRIGSQLVVRESQAAVFFRDGKALDTFRAGRHTLTTLNVPLLTGILGQAFDGRSPFTAEVYFVALRDLTMNWGTPQPIIVRNPGMGLGIALLQAFGSYIVAVTEPQQFVSQFVGQTGRATTDDVKSRLRGIVMNKFQDTLATFAKQMSVPDIIMNAEEIRGAMRGKLQEDFAAIGLVLKDFQIESLKPSEKSAEELRAMGMLDMATYTQLQAADAMRDAAQNPSGGLAGAGVGLGAGVSLGQMMTQAFQQGQQAQQPPATPAQPAGGGGGGGGGAMPDVMTPAQAATYLQVSEADVMQMIEAGELKAKKLGSQFRISKSVLEEFLKG